MRAKCSLLLAITPGKSPTEYAGQRNPRLLRMPESKGQCYRRLPWIPSKPSFHFVSDGGSGQKVYCKVLIGRRIANFQISNLKLRMRRISFVRIMIKRDGLPIRNLLCGGSARTAE